MPSVTRGAKKGSSDGLPHSAHADVPLAVSGPFDDGNANVDGAADHNSKGANMSAAEEPRMGAAEDPGRFEKMEKILEKQLKAMKVTLEKALEATISQMQATQAQRDEETRKSQERMTAGLESLMAALARGTSDTTPPATSPTIFGAVLVFGGSKIYRPLPPPPQFDKT